MERVRIPLPPMLPKLGLMAFVSIIQDTRPMPPVIEDEDEDAKQFDATDPWVEPPIRMDYGYNVSAGPGAFINFNAVFLDTCKITIGARVLIGSNCSFYSGTHPLDPALRNGTAGPELGKPIEIGEDSWLGGNVTVLPGVKVGRGCVLGAGSVVTKVSTVLNDCKWKRHLTTLITGRTRLSCGGWESSEDHSQD